MASKYMWQYLQKERKGMVNTKFSTAASYVGEGYEWAHGQDP